MVEYNYDAWGNFVAEKVRKACIGSVAVHTRSPIFIQICAIFGGVQKNFKKFRKSA